MAENIKHIKDQIWYVKQDITKAEKERDEWFKQYTMIQSILEANPGDAGSLGLKTEIEQQLAVEEAKLAPLVEKLAGLQAQLPQEPEPSAPKFDPAQHPLLKKTLEKSEPEKPVVIFKAGDMCEGQWSDKQWYKAKVKTVLGSGSALKYYILFVDYDETMTVDRDAVRPLQSKRKRDIDPAPAAAIPPQSAPVTSTQVVISGSPSINPKAQAAAKDTLAQNPEAKKRKIPNQKQVEKSVNSWKDWNSKGVGKKLAKKESMFRSGTTVNSRVGFTGSGAGMTETNKRVRYNNKADAVADEEENGSSAKAHYYPSLPPKRSRH